MARDSQPETISSDAPRAAPLQATATQVILCVNPTAGSRRRQRRAAAIGSAVRAAGYDVCEAFNLNQLVRLANDGDSAGRLRAVIAMGGDGTASAVRNAVPLAVPLVPVPLGTENLLARYLGQRANGQAVCETLRDGVVISLDLGRANHRYFLLMVSAGFDAEVVRQLHTARRGNISHLSYVKPTLKAIRSYRYPELRLYCGRNGKAPAGNRLALAPSAADEASAASMTASRHVFGFNLPLYAFGLAAAPRASGTDGLLDVCTFERGSLLGTFRYLWHVALGSHGRLADTAFAQCGRFRIEAPHAEHVAFQLDGDFGGELPVEVEVLPGQLRLLVPRPTAQRLGFSLPPTMQPQ